MAASRVIAPTDAFAFVREVEGYAIYMLDPEGRILTWNSGARAIKGYSDEEAVGGSFARFFTPEDRAAGRPAALMARAALEGRAHDQTWRVRKDGSRFWADVVLTAVHDDDGALRGYVKVTRDLTERRRAEELLRQSEERFRLMVESVRDYAIFMLDPEGRVATWNVGAERIKGYRADEIIGRHFSIFYPPEVAVIGHPERELELAVAEGRYEEEGWRVRKDGGLFWANVVITAVHDPTTGALRGFAKVTRDLTERRRMEEATRSANEATGKAQTRARDAESALLLRDEFISVAAHELRTPLTALQLKLQGLHSLLHKAALDPAAKPSKLGPRLDGALRQVGRLTELVDRFLDVSRIARGHLPLALEETDLGALVRQVADDLSEPAEKAGSRVHVVASEDLAGAWDRARLEQVFVNLISNAIKYGAGRPIEIEVLSTGAAVRVVVTDHGIGIAPEDLDRIFGRFERAASLRYYGGLGLGLYITRNVVEAHGGTIQVTSRVGEGTAFVVDLPKRLQPVREIAS